MNVRLYSPRNQKVRVWAQTQIILEGGKMAFITATEVRVADAAAFAEGVRTIVRPKLMERGASLVIPQLVIAGGTKTGVMRAISRWESLDAAGLALSELASDADIRAMAQSLNAEPLMRNIAHDMGHTGNPRGQYSATVGVNFGNFDQAKFDQAKVRNQQIAEENGCSGVMYLRSLGIDPAEGQIAMGTFADSLDQLQAMRDALYADDEVLSLLAATEAQAVTRTIERYV